MKHPEGVLKGAKELIGRLFSILKQPFRLVVRMIDKVNTIEQIEPNLTLEQVYHSKFHRFNGLVLCPYDISRTQSIHMEMGRNYFR